MNIKHKIMMAGMIGNLAEAFDMAISGLLSVFLAKYLTSNTKDGLFLILTTFFLGFLARPIGALILGVCSDLYGRKKTLAASILIMGVSTACIGMIPSYAFLGGWSVFFLLTLRIIQNLSCGAELMNSSSYLVESTHSGKGFSGSWAAFGATAGTLLASMLLCVITITFESHPSLEWFLWRIPFLFALVGALIGLYVRLFIPESKEYVLHYATVSKPMFRELLTQSYHHIRLYKTHAICVFLLSGLGVSATCLMYIFPSIQVNVYHNFTLAQILISNILSLTVMLVCFPWMGKLSDVLNKTIVIRYASMALLVILYPFFHTLSAGSFRQLIVIQAVIAIPAAAYYATVPSFLAELFPLGLRCTVLSVIYASAASLFGGCVPLLSLYLINVTHSPTSPLLIVLGLVVLVSLFLNGTALKESSLHVSFQK